MHRLSHYLLGFALSGVFIGGTDFLVDYRDPHQFNLSKIEAHSVNAGVSFSLTRNLGVDVLPIIVGTDGHRPTAAAAIFWRWYLWTPQ